jgi:hypothetical protein
MAHSYTPGLRVTEYTTLRKARRLPLPGEVRAKVGDRVSARDVVAATALPGTVTTVNVAREINCQPQELPRFMVKHEGDIVRRGEVIAETKALWGILHSEATAPVEGTIETISAVTGQVLVRGKAVPVEELAYVDGTVVEVMGDEGVVIECSCALVQGIFGFGGETFGELKVISRAPEDILDASGIDESCAGKVLVGGSLVTLEAMHRAVEVKAAGIIVGGLNDVDLDSFLGYVVGVAITGQEHKGITVILTEGFGQIAMAQRTFDLLRAHEGKMASINGATQIRAGVIRPEVVIPQPEGAVAEAHTIEGLQVGSSVRLIRDPHFGKLATVTALPEELQQIETESYVRVLAAKLADTGEEITVPRANVELIER